MPETYSPDVPMSSSLLSSPVLHSFTKRASLQAADIGKIVGGVCGGVFLVVALIFAMVYARRRENLIDAGLPVYPPRVVDGE
jgi:hypothetical protein